MACLTGYQTLAVCTQILTLTLSIFLSCYLGNGTSAFVASELIANVAPKGPNNQSLRSDSQNYEDQQALQQNCCFIMRLRCIKAWYCCKGSKHDRFLISAYKDV